MTEATAVTPEQLKAFAAATAAADPEFRAALLANPNAAVEKLFGEALPANVKIQAVEEPADTYIVVVPHVTSVGAAGELSDDDLESVAGGAGKGRAGGWGRPVIGSAAGSTPQFGNMFAKGPIVSACL